MSLKLRALLVWILISCAWFAATGYVTYRWAKSDLFHMRLDIIEADRGKPIDPYTECMMRGLFIALHDISKIRDPAECNRFKTNQSAASPSAVTMPTLAHALLRRAPVTIPLVFGLPAAPFLLLWWWRRRGLISAW